MVCVCFHISGAPEGSTDSGSGEAGDRTCDPWFYEHSAYPIQNTHNFTLNNFISPNLC